MIMLPILRNIDNYRVKFSNKMNFDEMKASNTSNVNQLTAGWICLAIATQAYTPRSGIADYLKTGAKLFTELVKENDGEFNANPFLVSNEVLYGIGFGSDTVTKNKSFPKNHASDDLYHRLEYFSKVELPNSEEDEFLQFLRLSHEVDKDEMQSYSIAEMYEIFLSRINEMPMFKQHWNSLIISMNNTSLTGQFTKEYLQARKNGAKHKLTVAEYQKRAFEIITECHVFEIEDNSSQDLNCIEFADFELLFTNEFEASDKIRSKFIPAVTENKECKDIAVEFLAQLEVL